MRRRAAVEPVIGHINNDLRMDWYYLSGTQGDAINAILAAAGYNFRPLLEWLWLPLRVFLAALLSCSANSNLTMRETHIALGGRRLRAISKHMIVVSDRSRMSGPDERSIRQGQGVSWGPGANPAPHRARRNFGGV
jgi:hypothetical protein